MGVVNVVIGEEVAFRFGVELRLAKIEVVDVLNRLEMVVLPR